MKSQVAVMLVLTKQLAQEKPLPPVGLLLTSDEEIGGFDGTNYLIKKLKLKPKFVLAGEPTWLKIGQAAKGIIRLKLTAQGQSAHAAKPWEGKNAIVALVRALTKIERVFPTPGQPTAQTTVSITTIRGGEATNQIPAQSEARLDIRYTPTKIPAKIIAKIRKLVFPVKVVVENVEPAAFCEPTSTFITNLSKAVEEVTGKKDQLIAKEAASDVRFFTARGIPGVVFGPGGGGSHAEREFVSLGSLFTFYQILENFLKKCHY
jgi:succinyl-diaminopimelate desuccinylase